MGNAWGAHLDDGGPDVLNEQQVGSAAVPSAGELSGEGIAGVPLVSSNNFQIKFTNF